MKLFVLFFSFFVSAFASAQLDPVKQTAEKPFFDFIKGVKYAHIYTTPEQEALIGEDVRYGQAHFAVADFLKRYGFEEVGLSAKFRDFIPESYCDMANIAFEMDMNGVYITTFNLLIKDCQGGSYMYSLAQSVKIKRYDIPRGVQDACRQILGGYQKGYSTQNRIHLVSRETGFTKDSMKAFWKKNGLRPIEGFYNQISSEGSRYKLGLFCGEGEGQCELVYFDGAENFKDWKNGDLKAILYPTSSPSRYRADWYMINKNLSEDNYIEFTQSGMLLRSEDGSETEYVKIFPTATDEEFFASASKSSGSGFAVSNNGIIATNAHVVEGAKKVFITGGILNGQKYECEVLLVDSKNDLALLKIKQDAHSWNLPYIMGGSISRVGTSVYTLGYPLIETMGTEIKLTDGIISSKTGFQGDFSMYQTSIAVQPGNSGGPLFDNNGVVVGVVSAKHGNAENASYAVKVNYLLGLLHSLDDSPSLPEKNLLLGKSLADQVESANDYVFVVEAELTY